MIERGKVRRVVTGHDKNGKAIVIEDGLAPSVRSNPLRPGHISIDLWRTNTAPVPLAGAEPDPTAGPLFFPTVGGRRAGLSPLARSFTPSRDAIELMPPQGGSLLVRSLTADAGSWRGEQAFRSVGSEVVLQFLVGPE